MAKRPFLDYPEDYTPEQLEWLTAQTAVALDRLSAAMAECAEAGRAAAEGLAAFSRDLPGEHEPQER